MKWEGSESGMSRGHVLSRNDAAGVDSKPFVNGSARL